MDLYDKEGQLFSVGELALLLWRQRATLSLADPHEHTMPHTPSGEMLLVPVDIPGYQSTGDPSIDMLTKQLKKLHDGRHSIISVIDENCEAHWLPSGEGYRLDII